MLARAGRRRRDADTLVGRRDRQLSRMLEATDEGYVSIDAEGEITAWSAQATALFGWPAAEVLGLPLSETLIPEADREAHAWGFSHYTVGSPSAVVSKRSELRALHRDGHEIPVEVAVWSH